MSNIDISGIRRVLIIKLRHIGDVLLTAPTFKAIKEALPGVHTAALVPAGTEDMLTLNPDVDEVITFKKGGGASAELKLVKKLRDGRYDLAINMTEGDRGAILARLSGARLRIGINPNGRGFMGKRFVFTHMVEPAFDGRHKAVADMDVLKPLGIKPGGAVVELYTSAEDDAYIAGLLDENGIGRDMRFAVAHPTSRWLFKCWRDEAVASVIDYLEISGVRVVVTCGPDKREVERVGRILSFTRSKPIELSGRLSLKRMASLCRRSALFFGVDTAPMHIAAAVGTPVVALFGPSDFRVWGPLTGSARVIAKKDMFPCLPCRQDGCGGSKKSVCLDAITVEEVVEAIGELMGDGR